MNFRKILLTGTALVAVSSFFVPCVKPAEAANLAIGVDSIWASDGTPGVPTPATKISEAEAGDAVDIQAPVTLTVTNNQVADDGNGLDTFKLGAITNTTIDLGNVAVTLTAAGGGIEQVDITSLDVKGNFSVVNANAINASQTVTVGTATVGGNLSVLNQEATNAVVTSVTASSLSITGTTTLTAGIVNGAATASLLTKGASVFTGAVTVTGGTNIASTSTLEVQAATTFTTGLTLTDGLAGSAHLHVNSAVKPIITGTIDGGVAGDGVITISAEDNVNNFGATFKSAIGATKSVGAVNVYNVDAKNSAAVFQASVKSTGIVMGNATGGANVDNNTITFDGSTTAFTIFSTVDGDVAANGDFNTVKVLGGQEITASGAWGSSNVIDSVILSGAGTKLTLLPGSTLNADILEVGAGSILNMGANVTAATDISGAVGTISINGNFTHTGAIDNTSGSGAIETTAAHTGAASITGDIGATKTLSTITLGGKGTLTLGGDTQATNINFNADGAISLAAGKKITGSLDNLTVSNGIGSLTLLGGIQEVTGSIGATRSLKTITVQGGGTDTFGGAINAQDFVFGGVHTVNFNESLTLGAGIDFGGNAGIVNLFAGKSIAGAVDSVGGAAGTLNLLGGTQSVSGAIGTTNAITKLNIASGNASFASAIKATTISVSSGSGVALFNENITGDLVLTGTATIADTKTVTGNVTGGAVSAGTLVFSGTSSGIGTIGVGGNFLAALTLNGTTTTVTTTGDIFAADVTSIAGNQLISTGGAFTLGVGQQLKVDIIGKATSGKVVATAGAASINPGAKIELNVNTNEYITTGESFTIVDGVAAGGAVSTLTAGNLTWINSGTGLISFAQDTTNLDDFVVKATRSPLSTLSTTANNTAVGDVLDVLGLNGDATLDAVQASLQNATTTAELNNILESLLPVMDASVQNATLAVGAAMQDMADTRLAYLRYNDPMAGVSSGVSTNGAAMWIETYARAAQQDQNGPVKGYTSDTVGGVIGMDTIALIDGVTLGLAGGYAASRIDSQNANTTTTSIDSFGGYFYGNFDLVPQVFMTVNAGYAENSIQHDRHNSGAAGLISHGEYKSKQSSARLALGHEYYSDYGLNITPALSAAYTFLNTEGYTETGTGANLTVDPIRQRLLNLGISINAEMTFEDYQGSQFRPAVHIGYNYESVGEAMDVVSTLVGGGTSFQTRAADPVQTAFSTGGGFTYASIANWDLKANYDYAAKTGYEAHSGVLRITSHF